MTESNSFLPSELSRVVNADRLLPNQPTLSIFFKGDRDTFAARLETVTNSVLSVANLRDKWDLTEAPSFSYEALGSDLSGLHFLQVLVRLGNVRTALEVGTYIGVSTLFLAEAVGPDGQVVTIEVGEEFSEIARENFRRNGMEARIELINSDVASVLPSFTSAGKAFDMVFLDGDKGSYGVLIEPLYTILRPGGLMVVDDVFCNGDTLNEMPTSDKGRGVKALLDKVAALPPDHTRVILPFGNGQLLITKPE